MHSVRQFELVLALAPRRHFGLAAKDLGVSQPALTRSLKQLQALRPGRGGQSFPRLCASP
jgi:DNA-binding transcriptional LysR family regulator